MWELCRLFKLIFDNQEKEKGYGVGGGGVDNKSYIIVLYNSKVSPCLEFHSYVSSGTSNVL